MSTQKIATFAAGRARLVAIPDLEAGWYAGGCPCGWHYVGTYGTFERHADVCPRLRHLREEERIEIGPPIRVLVCSPDESGGVA